MLCRFENVTDRQPRKQNDSGVPESLLRHRLEERQRITSESRQLGMDVQHERGIGVRFEGSQAAAFVRHVDDGGIPFEKGFHIGPEGLASGENDGDWHLGKGSIMLLRNQ